MRTTISLSYLAMLLLALLSTDPSYAQETEKLPGDTSLPSSAEELQALAALDGGNYAYSVEDYFRNPDQSSLQFSPDGKYLSYEQRDAQGKQHVFIKDTETGEVRQVITETDQPIYGYFWINNQFLGYVQDKKGNENFHVYAVDVNGQNDKNLTPFEGVRMAGIILLRETPDEIIILLNKDDPQNFEPFRINIKTAAIEKLYAIDDPENPIMGYEFDKEGVLRAISRRYDGVRDVLYYRENSSSPFEEVVTTGWKDEFEIIKFD